MSTYDRLVQQKQHGEKLEMKRLTYEVLRQLWWEEDCSDGTIAKLFDVPKKKITNLRFKWGLKLPEAIVSEFETRYDGSVPTMEEDATMETLSKQATVLLRKLNGLNDIELESLQLELARRFPAFAEVKRENDFIQLAERVIRQFGNQK